MENPEKLLQLHAKLFSLARTVGACPFIRNGMEHRSMLFEMFEHISDELMSEILNEKFAERND